MTQFGLNDFDEDGVTQSAKNDKLGTPRNQLALKGVSDDAVLDDDSCPWCLHPADDFRDAPHGVGCPNCEALIPVDADWYKRGEKIVI